jgi:hypothetical protein
MARPQCDTPLLIVGEVLCNIFRLEALEKTIQFVLSLDK